MLLADMIYHSFIYLCVNELFLFSYWLCFSFRQVAVIWLIIKLITPTKVYHWWCDKVHIFIITSKFIICNPLQILQMERNFKPLNLSHKMFLKDVQRNKNLVTFVSSTLGRSWALNFPVCLSTFGVLASLWTLPTCCAVPGSWFGELILALNWADFGFLYMETTQLKGYGTDATAKT